VLNNTRPTKLKGENKYWHVTFTFYYQSDQISSPNHFFRKSLWPRLTLYWCDARMPLCLDAFVVSWRTHGHCDNLGLFKTFNFGMYARCSNLEWRNFLYTFYWKKIVSSNFFCKYFFHCKVFLNLYLLQICFYCLFIVIFPIMLIGKYLSCLLFYVTKVNVIFYFYIFLQQNLVLH
jgi:hypothetical protein